jgi:hypothetical protein
MPQPDAAPPRKPAAKSPPLNFADPEPPPRKAGEPFSKPAPRPPAAAASSKADLSGWKSAKRGLGLVSTGLFFLMLGTIAGPGLKIAEHFGVALPDKNPGYLGQDGIPAAKEIHDGAVAIPAALGMLFVFLGRLMFGSLPTRSFAKGPARLAWLATLLGGAGLVAVLVTGVLQTLNGAPPLVESPDWWSVRWNFLPSDELSGVAQRVGFGLAVMYLPLAEVAFVSAIGRLGAGLHDERAVGRHTRFLLLAGSLAATAGVVTLTQAVDPQLFAQGRSWVDRTVEGALSQVGNVRPVVVAGIWIAVALVGWLIYARLVGGGRRAVRNWLDAHEPA